MRFREIGANAHEGLVDILVGSLGIDTSIFVIEQLPGEGHHFCRCGHHDVDLELSFVTIV